MSAASDATPTVAEWAQGLIELGQFMLAHEALCLARSKWSDSVIVDVPEAMTVNVSCIDGADLAEKTLALGGGQKYSDLGENYAFTGVRREFTGGHVIDVYVTSDLVCTPKRRESREVPVVELTDEARAQIAAIKAACTRVERREVVTEWDCPPSFLELGAS